MKMRYIRHGLLLLFGCFFMAVAVFAFKFGWDPSPSWGKSRTLSFVIGTIFMVIFADLHFGQSLTEELIRALNNRFNILLEKIPAWMRPQVQQKTRMQLIYTAMGIIFVLMIVLYAWFISTTTWTRWPNATNYYSLLADAFKKGHTSIDIEVNPQLLTLENPYDPQARIGLDYLWDASLYKGKYYFYWGPAPAILLTVIKLIHPFEVGDNLVALAAAILLFLAQMFLLMNLWRRYFEHLPGWTLMLGVLLAGAINPITWMLRSAMVYEAAILWAQAFLMAGLYFAYKACEKEPTSYWLLAWASIFWVAAIATRTTTIFPVLFFLICVLTRAFLIHGITRQENFRLLFPALGLPMLMGAVMLGAYNFVRFDSIFDFGFEYQLTVYDNHKYEGVLFSNEYIPANVYNYLFIPPEKTSIIPHLRAKQGNQIEAFGMQIPKLYYTERVTGLFYTLPFLIFAFMPLAKQSQKHKAGAGLLNWFRIMLGGSALLAMGTIVCFIYSTMRYEADVTPSLALLATIGFWSGYETAASDKFVQFVYSCAGLLLAGISIVVPNLLALNGFS